MNLSPVKFWILAAILGGFILLLLVIKLAIEKQQLYWQPDETYLPVESDRAEIEPSITSGIIEMASVEATQGGKLLVEGNVTRLQVTPLFIDWGWYKADSLVPEFGGSDELVFELTKSIMVLPDQRGNFALNIPREDDKDRLVIRVSVDDKVKIFTYNSNVGRWE